MNILFDIFGLITNKKIVKAVEPDDFIVLGRNEPPDITGVASPIPTRSVKLIKASDLISSGNCSYDNVTNSTTPGSAGVYYNNTLTPCVVELRSFRAIGNNITVTENGKEIEVATDGEPNTANNIGTGIGLYKGKTGEILNFKSLESTDGSVSIINNTNTVGLKVQAYTTAQEEGVSLPISHTINFTGTGVTATDINGVTTVVIPGYGSTGLNYKGLWNATLNSPTLTSSVGTAGDFYIVSVAGTTNLNGITDWQISDWAVFAGGVWQKIDNHDVQAYNTVKDESTSLPQRSVLKFAGTGVTATDSGGETLVTIPIQPAYATIKDEGSALTQRSVINFVGTGVTASDVAGETQVSISSGITQAYTTVQDESISLTQRNTIDFQGLGVSVTDDGSKTIVTVLNGLPAASYGLYAQTANSTPITATITPTSLIGSGTGTLSVPANGFLKASSFKGDFGGVMSSKNNDTLRIRVTSNSVTLADSGPQTMPLTSNDVWALSINFTVRQIGAPGVASIVTLGEFHHTKTSNGTQEGFAFNTVNNTTFDTTTSNTLDVTLQWSSTSAINNIYSDIFILNKIY